jgi:hypothetical protein
MAGVFMNIKFVLGKISSVKNNKSSICKIVAADADFSLYEGKYGIPPQNLINSAKVLIKNKDFLRFIKEYRAEFNIPEKGYSYKKCFELDFKYKKLGLKNPFLKLFYKIAYKIQKKEIFVDSLIRPHLFTLTIGSFIGFFQPEIPAIEIEYSIGPYEPLIIKVNFKTKFSSLRTYLEKNKKIISKNIDALYEKPIILTREEIMMADLRKNGITIMDAMEEGSKKSELAGILEDMKDDAFRKRIDRTNDNIDSLFVYRGQKK